ncbi:MAG: RNA pseudouridine synthase [Bdellovibrionaceae bacterium]|nr:RNA pseudouridine synthase [Pseudobdellovibrionaceae bacterium]NUM58278.1 RNA pseudouridine synthase [Pseudobdellovibrionaceae bacterium]
MDILLENEDFIIINKPHSVSCHNDTNSIENLFQKRDGKKVHFVNRLDKETSGLMMLTYKGQRQEDLTQALKMGLKKYIAVLRGTLPLTEKNSPITWNSPLTDKAESRLNPQGKTQERIPALTTVRILKNSSYFSMAECLIETGRQHQIRKHAAIAGHSILCDPRYGNPKDNERIQKIYGLNRLALHAWKLEFTWKNQIYQPEAFLPKEFEYLFAH